MAFARPAHAAQQSTGEAEATLTADVNQERTSRGLGSLTVASDLVALAQQHSAEMAAAGRPYHDPNIQSRVQNWQELGDNVGSGPDADHLHNGFMNSQVHRDEILHSTYSEVGVGCYWAGNVLYVTEIFRLPEHAQAPAASRATAPARPAAAPRVATRTIAVPAAPAAAPTPAAPATTSTAPPTTAASPSTSTSLVAAAAEQWPPASVLAAHRSANSESPDTTLQALAVVAAVLLMLVAGVEVAHLRRRAARS